MIQPVEAELGYSAPFYVVNVKEISSKFMLMLTCARDRLVVRFDGGCGFMSAADAQGMYDLFVTAFRGFGGAMLFGGTRMLRRDNPEEVVPSITEIPPLILEANPECAVLGVIPKTRDLEAIAGIGNVVGLEDDYYTITHPYQTSYILVQDGADDVVPWETENKVCLDIMQQLRAYARFKSLTIVYNGGQTTEKNLLATARRGWPILLLDGSGRMAQQYARDREFLMEFPNVSVCQNEAASLRNALVELDVVQSEMGQLRAVPRLKGNIA